MPAAEAAYVPSVNPTNGRSAAKLIMKMLVALQPFCGLWIGPPMIMIGQRAFDLLATTVVRSHTWGAPLDAWPGCRPGRRSARVRRTGADRARKA